MRLNDGWLAIGVWTLLCLSSSVLSGCAERKDPVSLVPCDGGVVVPLADVPDAERPATVGLGLQAMAVLWGRPTSATLRCPEVADQQIVVSARQPPLSDFSSYSAPPQVPQGGIYHCDNAAAGEGLISIDGMAVDGTAVVVEDVPFKIAILLPQRFTLVDGAARLDLSVTAWDEVVINYGIDNQTQLYGNVFFSRVFANSGESMQCRMTDFTAM